MYLCTLTIRNFLVFEISKQTGMGKSMELVKAMDHWLCIEEPKSHVKVMGICVEKVTQAS